MKLVLATVATGLSLALGGCQSQDPRFAEPSPTPTAAPATSRPVPPQDLRTPTLSTPPSLDPNDVVVNDGVYTVAKDIPAGVYRTDGAPAGCRFLVTLTGTDGASVVRQGEGGGQHQVTLVVGQDFRTAGCGLWTHADG